MYIWCMSVESAFYAYSGRALTTEAQRQSKSLPAEKSSHSGEGWQAGNQHVKKQLRK